MAQRNHIPAVEQSIVNVLIERGFDIAKDRALFDQAHDYGEMWGVKEKLLQDIAERGVTIVQPSGVQKKNDSVDCLVRVNAQMLKILAYLKIEPAEVETCEEVDESDDGL